MKLKPCADNVLNVRSKPQVHICVPVRSGGPQIVPPVQLASDVQRVPALPLEVLMVVSSNTHSVPSAVGVHSGLKVPVLELSVHTVGLTAASKLPLLCARAIDAESTAIANTSTDIGLFMVSS